MGRRRHARAQDRGGVAIAAHVLELEGVAASGDFGQCLRPGPQMVVRVCEFDCAPDQAEALKASFSSSGETVYQIGEIHARTALEQPVVIENLDSVWTV